MCFEQIAAACLTGEDAVEIGRELRAEALCDFVAVFDALVAENESLSRGIR